MPAFMLKKIVLGNFAKGPVDPKMADAIDFMVDRVSISTVLTVYSVDDIISVISTIFDLPLIKCHKKYYKSYIQSIYLSRFVAFRAFNKNMKCVNMLTFIVLK